MREPEPPDQRVLSAFRREVTRREVEELRALVKKGRLSSVAAQAALEAIERERTELVFHAS